MEKTYESQTNHVAINTIAHGQDILSPDWQNMPWIADNRPDALRQKFTSRIRESYLVYTKELLDDEPDLLKLPVFLAMFL